LTGWLSRSQVSTGAADWRSWPDEHKQKLLERLRLRETYPPVALRPKQIIGDHPLVVLIAGRRSGKTLAAAEWLAGRLTASPTPGLHAVVAPTYGQARDVCIEQPRSGLLDALARRGVDVARTGVGEWQWNRTIGELRRDGQPVVRIDSLEDGAQRIRGHAVAACWVDELRLAPDRMGAWALDESIRPALSGSEHGQMVVTTTPAPTKLVRQVMSDPFADVRRMTLWDNAENLPDRYLQEMRDRYAGTRIGRQELEGILLEDVEGALWRRDWIEATRTALPPLFWESKVMGLDPSDGTEGGAEQGIAIAGIGSDWDMYVTHSDGLRVSGLEYCKHAVRLAVEEECSRIIVERNHGGTYLVELLEQAMRLTGLQVAVQVVTASRSKRARAEPVAALYEQGKARHLGVFLELEDQMTSFTGLGREESPDRLDACVWALLELKGRNWHGPASGEQAAVPYTDQAVAGGAVGWA